MIPCLFCGGDRSAPDDWRTCDGWQGQVEADYNDICANRHKGNERSQDANRDTAPRKLRARERLLQAWEAYGAEGTIAEVVGDVLGMRHQTCSARCSELKRDGLLVRTGRTARTSSGSLADVLVLARSAPAA